jgi:hypothetical protein
MPGGFVILTQHWFLWSHEPEPQDLTLQTEYPHDTGFYHDTSVGASSPKVTLGPNKT